MNPGALTLIIALAFPATGAAQDPPVGGFLSVKDAISFQKKYFPPQAPNLLRDERATFFHTKRPIHVANCRRVARPNVICRFSLVLRPDRAHRKANWFPIKCRGKVRSRHRTDGSIVGDVRNYRCRTMT